MPERPAGMAYAPAMTRAALTQGWVRLARAGIFGGSSLLLATAGHTVGGGALPGAGLLALTGVGSALVAVSLTARRVRFTALLAVLSVEQVLLHLVFHAATAAGGCADLAMPGHTMAASTVCGPAVSSSAVSTSAAYGWSMLLGHVVAVVITAWLLARGERWLWRAVDRVHAYASVRPSRLRRALSASIAARAATRTRFTWLPASPRAPPVV
jgi:hypothetical protein